MKLESLSIENFKCFKKAKIDFSKITLLTGANSSGKSSILYSILGPLQSGEFPLKFSPNGNYVKMGDFKEIVHLNDSSKTIKVEFCLSDKNIKYDIITYWNEDKNRKLPKLVSFETKQPHFELKVSKPKNAIKYLFEFFYYPDKDPNKKNNSPEIFKEIAIQFDKLLKIENDPKQFNRYSKHKDYISFKFNDFNEIENSLRTKGNFTSSLLYRRVFDLIKSFSKNLNFVSSFRLYPERTYYETSKENLKVGKFGENYEDQIVLWESRKSKQFTELQSTLQELQLINQIKANRLPGGRFELRVKNKRNGVESTLNDVGFGVSQFLPIIVSDIQLGANSTLCIAQPEIHLHPSIQANLGNYLEKNISKNKNYIIETHSEYLINRLRLLIVEGKIKEEDISIYYFKNNGKKSNIHKIQFQKNGSIKNAPADFFETYMMDTLDITLKAT